MSGEWPIKGKRLNIGILGMTEGNGHPYSWSAIFNGYNKKYMDECPFPVIKDYLYKQPENSFGIEGGKNHAYMLYRLERLCRGRENSPCDKYRKCFKKS